MTDYGDNDQLQTMGNAIFFTILHSNSTNSPVNDSSSSIPIINIFIGLFVSILEFVNLFGNALVVIAFCRNRKLRIARNYFIFNLAVADLIIALVSVPFYLPTLWTGRWLFGEVFCIIWIVINSTARIESVIMVVFISYDRYKLVYQPFLYRARQNVKRAIIILSVSWLLVIIIKVPFIFYGELHLMQRVNVCSCSPGVRYDVPYIIGHKDYDIIYTTIAVFTEYLIPLLLFVTWDLKVYQKIRHQLRRTGDSLIFQTPGYGYPNDNENKSAAGSPNSSFADKMGQYVQQWRQKSNLKNPISAEELSDIREKEKSDETNNDDAMNATGSMRERKQAKCQVQIIDVTNLSNYDENNETYFENSKIYMRNQNLQNLHPLQRNYLFQAPEKQITPTLRKGSYNIEMTKFSYPRRRLNSCPPIPCANFFLQHDPPMKAKKLLGISTPIKKIAVYQLFMLKVKKEKERQTTNVDFTLVRYTK